MYFMNFSFWYVRVIPITIQVHNHLLLVGYIFVDCSCIDSKQPDYSQGNYPPSNYNYGNKSFNPSSQTNHVNSNGKDNTTSMFWLLFFKVNLY